MKKYLLTIIFFIPVFAIAQRKSFNQEFQELKNPVLKSESYKASKKLNTAGALLGIGGALIGTSILLSTQPSTQGQSTGIKATAIGGGLFCLIGGIVLGNVGQHLIKMERKGVTSIRFNGNALVYNF